MGSLEYLLFDAQVRKDHLETVESDQLSAEHMQWAPDAGTIVPHRSTNVPVCAVQRAGTVKSPHGPNTSQVQLNGYTEEDEHAPCLV